MDYNKIKTFLKLVEKRPLMFIDDNSYSSLSNFLNGYIFGLSNFDETFLNFNEEFSQMIKKSKKPSSLYWTEYVYYILANENDELAKKLIFKKIHKYLNIKMK